LIERRLDVGGAAHPRKPKERISERERERGCVCEKDERSKRRGR